MDYRKGKFKNICYIGDTGSKCQPGIWLSPENNNLIFRFRTSEILRNYIKHKNKCFRSLGTKEAKENYTRSLYTLWPSSPIAPSQRWQDYNLRAKGVMQSIMF